MYTHTGIISMRTMTREREGEPRIDGTRGLRARAFFYNDLIFISRNDTYTRLLYCVPCTFRIIL